MTTVDIPALVVGITVIVLTLILIGWVLYMAWLGPDGDEDD